MEVKIAANCLPSATHQPELLRLGGSTTKHFDLEQFASPRSAASALHRSCNGVSKRISAKSMRWWRASNRTCEPHGISPVRRSTQRGAFTQLPWNPSGTRCPSLTTAVGPLATSVALKTARSLRSPAPAIPRRATSRRLRLLHCSVQRTPARK